MTEYTDELERTIEELQRKLAIYEEVSEHLLPLICHSNAQLENNAAWLKAIRPRLEPLIALDDTVYCQSLIDKTTSFANSAENEYIELSRKIHVAKYGPNVPKKIWHKPKRGEPGIFIDRDDPRTGYENTK
jgi:hypothetical protein